MEFGERVKALRIERGLNQGELAARAGINHGGLCKLERGQSQPQLRTAQLLAKALGVSLDALAPAVDEGQQGGVGGP